MRAKKRTVWLLTLMSLIAVVAVFIIVDPTKELSIQSIFSDVSLNDTLLGIEDKTAIPVTTESHEFDNLRMELSNERSKLRAQYLDKIASEQISAEEKSETFNLLYYLVEQESAEALAEMQIKSFGYSDVFVKVDEDKIHVTVLSEELSKELSKEKVNEIVYLLKKEINETAQVTVNVKSEYY